MHFTIVSETMSNSGRTGDVLWHSKLFGEILGPYSDVSDGSHWEKTQTRPYTSFKNLSLSAG
jgi:hypothetical protein